MKILEERYYPATMVILFLLCLQVFVSPVMAAPQENSDWQRHGLDHEEQRFSPLKDINQSNVNKLGIEWHTELPTIDDGLAATPIVVDGVIYMSSSFANVFAIDARNGEILWHFDPEASVHSGFSNSWAARVNRGVAVGYGRVYVGTPDCRLIAIDRKSGEKVWDILTCDPTKEYAITGAPRIARGKVFLGNGISDFGARGYVSAYDAVSGDLIWRFWTVPGDPANGYENKTMEMAAKTWHEGWAKNGGGSAWDAIAYDPEFNQLYIGTDSSISYDPSVRSPGGGDNLFLNSIIALDADTGEYKWHYQTVPNDAWDYNAANHMILAELELFGSPRKVLMQAPKNGFFYILDRKDGKLLSASPYVGVTWASHIDIKTGRPVETAHARYYKNKDKSAEVIPSLIGGHNWHPMSYNRDTGLVYIPAHEFKTTYSVNPDSTLGGVTFDWYGSDLNEDKSDLDKAKAGNIGRLIGWDPIKGKARWTVDQILPMNSGVVSTAGGLLFQGTATGEFVAYAAESGKRLWSQDVQASVQAAPVTYRLDGKQYVLAPVGGGGIARFMIPLYGTAGKAMGPSRLIAFSLDGKAQLPEFQYVEPEVPEPPTQTASAETVAHGAEVFEVAACGLCHGSVAVGRRPHMASSVPDLRYMQKDTHENFKNIVIKGFKKPNGMLPFEGILSEQDVEAVHAYLIDLQTRLYRAQQMNK